MSLNTENLGLFGCVKCLSEGPVSSILTYLYSLLATSLTADTTLITADNAIITVDTTYL